jgi:predicted short-subunit dehydrogenase-like oxidoreductase (DUF2520 family)
MKPKIAVVGPGRLGQALAALLRQHGYPISAIVGRDLERTRVAARFIGAELMATTELQRCAAAEVIFITTADDDLAATARQLTNQVALRPEVLLVHCSGLHPATILHNQPTESAQILAMHPLQTFASSEQGLSSLAGSYYALEGEPAALEHGQQLVQDLGGTAFVIPAHSKALYHAAACMTANFVTTLFDCAAQVLASCNPEQQIPSTVLGPLLRTAVENTIRLGSETALTGPIVRGDTTTVAEHLIQLKQQQPQFVELYRQLGFHTVKLAQRSQRLSNSDAKKLTAILDAE